MKTYFRIISFARPFGVYVPQYLLYTLLYVAFSLIQFSVLMPLFDVLFNQVDPSIANNLVKQPEYEFSIAYLKQLFNYYFGFIIQEYGRLAALQFVCGVIVASVFLSNLFRYLSALILTNIRAQVLTNLRSTVFSKITRFHLGFFTNERKGDLISRMVNDVAVIESSVVSSLKVVFKEPLLIIAYFAVLFSMSFKLTLFTLILLPVSGAIISGIAKRLKKQATESQESIGRMVNIMDETLSGMRIVKAFTARNYVVNKFNKEVRNYAGLNVSMAKKNELAGPISEFLGVMVVAGILLYGGSLILNNESVLTASQFLTYIIFFTRVLEPAKAISNAFSGIQNGLACGERIFTIIDSVPKVEDRDGALEINGFNNRIEFKNVSFAYEKDPVIKNINLTIEKGKTIALVGSSGGGKSTLADLIPRFYDPQKGQILIDGVPIENYKLDSLRKLMGIVTQESILFHDSILNNIAFGIPNINREDVINAAKIANAHEFIINTEFGYDTVIGERGTKLSGGQRQRISIARAVLKNPPILILDEATSALDSESEKLVQDALNNLMKNRTSIVIAHRLSTIQHADEIIVVQNGEIVEKGTHDSLLETEGLYKKLSTIQAL